MPTQTKVLFALSLVSGCFLGPLEAGPIYQAPGGYYAAEAYRSSSVINAFAPDGEGGFWVNAGNRFFQVEATGTEREIYRDPGLVFPSFVAPLNGGELLVGESFSGQIWALDQAGPGGQTPRVIADLAGSFDGFALDERHWLISANTAAFPAADNQIYALDVEHGTVQPVIETGGYSGPLVMTGDGKLLYGTAQYGASALYQWELEDIRGWLGLGEKVPLESGAKVMEGLPAMSGLVMGDDPARVLFSTSWEGYVRRIDLVEGRSETFGVVVQGTPGVVHFERGSEPFQVGSGDGGALWINVTDWDTGTSTIFKVRAIPEPAQLWLVGFLILAAAWKRERRERSAVR